MTKIDDIAERACRDMMYAEDRKQVALFAICEICGYADGFTVDDDAVKMARTYENMLGAIERIATRGQA